MCIICDGGTYEELSRKITRHIAEVGWSVQGVDRQNGRLDWAYTIGLAERSDHPELAVTGMCCFPCAGNLLNQAARVVADGHRLHVGEELELSGPLRVGPVHPDQWQGDRFAGWIRHYGAWPEEPGRAALQMIWTDNGVWQDDPGRSRWRRERLDIAPRAALTARTGGPSTTYPHRRQRRQRRRSPQ